MKIDKELKKLIEKEAIALATSNEDKPHVIAVGFVKVVSKNQILITDNYMQETIKNLEKNKNVALAVWCSSWKENCIGYELEGIAEYFKEGKWHELIRSMPENQNMSMKGAILVTINKIKKVS
jgi:predicted pyridoxine 5'-phosphate oxidase superfamily flavin-nucleotide-binding protein